MKRRSWVIVLLMAWIHAPASADLYKYVDEQGRVHYTDDLGQVPAGQRQGVYEQAEPLEESVEVYEQVEPDEALRPPEEEKAETEEGDVGGSHGVLKKVAAPPGKEILAGDDKDAPRAHDLEESRLSLLKEYEALMGGQEEISRAKKRQLGPSARKALEEKIRKHNERVVAYEEKSQSFLKEVDVFNARREEEKAMREELRETEAKIQEEYEALREQKLEIERMSIEPLSRSDREIIAGKVREYNARVKAYQQRKEAFQKAIEYHNARIRNEVQGVNASPPEEAQ